MVRRVDGIEELLGAVDVLARADLLVLVDLGLCPGALHVGDRKRAEEDYAAVVYLERVAVERAHGRAGDAVALRVVLASVAGAAVAGRGDRLELGGAGQRVLLEGRGAGVLLADRAVRLYRAAEVGAAVRDDREARHLLLRLGVGDVAVVADEGRPPTDLALGRIDDEGGDEPLAEREFLDRPQVDLVLLLAYEPGEDREADDGQRDQASDGGAEPQGRALEEDAARHRGL